MTHLDQPSALDALREEAAIEPDPVHDGEVTKETQVIAIYGKGGSGKSFALSNLSYMMAQQGKRVLLDISAVEPPDGFTPGDYYGSVELLFDAVRP